jgi:hypothetical protein
MSKSNFSIFDRVVVAILCSAAAIAILYVFVGWDGIAKLLKHSATAAWVQAVGSVLAVLAAVWISQRTSAELRLERATERDAAYVLRLTQIASVNHYARHLAIECASHLRFDGDPKQKLAYLQRQLDIVDRVDVFKVPESKIAVAENDVRFAMMRAASALQSWMQNGCAEGERGEVEAKLSSVDLIALRAILLIRDELEKKGATLPARFLERHVVGIFGTWDGF